MWMMGTRGLAAALAVGLAGPVLAAGPSYAVNPSDAKKFYRTNFDTQTIATTCRAKSVTQAIYDPVANTTFVVYAAGFTSEPTGVPGVQFSAASPTIISYNHNWNFWEGPGELDDVSSVPFGNSDCHNYPQILIDDEGYLHVFHSFHAAGLNIRHYASEFPHSILGIWSSQEIPGTEHNTYGAAFRDNDGEMYVFFRSSYNKWDTVVPPRLWWYEPEMYVKSVDGGWEWDAPKLVVNPGRPSLLDNTEAATVTSLINNGGFNSIYTGDMHQDTATNRVSMISAPTYSHTERWGNHLYFSFDMDDDQVYSAGGVSQGATLDRTEYLTNNCCTLYTSDALFLERLSYYGHGISAQITLENGNPVVYHTRFESINPGAGTNTDAYYQGGWTRLRKATWNGSTFISTYLSGVANPALDPFNRDPVSGQALGVYGVFDAEYRPGKGTDLYIKTKWGGVDFWTGHPEYDSWDAVNGKYQWPLRVYNSLRGWGTSHRLFGDHPDWEVRGTSNFSLIPNSHPDIRAFVKVPKYSPTAISAGRDRAWAIGADYVYGEANLAP